MNQYLQQLERAYELAKTRLTDDEFASKMSDYERSYHKAVEQIKYNDSIRVPIVGDFSAGKSTLINSFLGIQLLPTAITPETAVAYELHYSAEEYLLHRSKEGVEQRYPLSQIGKFALAPGDLVLVYLNNPRLEELSKRGVILVDMPGIDSGIEAHEAAIMQYAQEGTHFVICMDVEQGTLRRTTKAFIEEMQTYGLGITMLITKADKKPASEAESVRALVEEQLASFSKLPIEVRLTSAIDGEVEPLAKALAELDVDSYREARIKPIVSSYVGAIVSDLNLLTQMEAVNTEELEVKEKEIALEREKAMAEMQNSRAEAQETKASADDVLADIRQALEERSGQLVAVFMANKSDTSSLLVEIQSIIRPVMVKSLERELGQYQAVFDGAMSGFEQRLSGLLPSVDSAVEGVLGELGKIIPGGLEGGLTTILAMLGKRIGGKIGLILQFLSTLSGPLLKVLEGLFGKVMELFGGSIVVDKVRAAVRTQVIPALIDHLRPIVEKIITDSRKQIDVAVESRIEALIKSYNDALEQARQVHRQEQAERERKKSNWQTISEELLGVLVTRL